MEITMTAAATLMGLNHLSSSAESCVEMGDNYEKKQPFLFDSRCIQSNTRLSIFFKLRLQERNIVHS